MGNRGNVVFTNADDSSISPCVYLHWNGGAESIYQFLDELDRRKIRADQNYEAARFVQVVGEFFDTDERGSLSLGVVNGPKEISLEGISEVYTDSGDNGFFVVDRTGEERRVRRFVYGEELTPEQVEEERQAAYKSDYAKDGGFRDVWGEKPISRHG